MSSIAPDQILRSLESDLNSWQPSTRVLVSVASDPFEVLELLAATGNQIRVILLWAGDEGVFDGNQEVGIVTNKYEVTITHNTGLAMVPGNNLHRRAITDRPALVELADQLRSRIRSLRFPSDETTSIKMEYQGADPVVTPEGIRADAYTLRFEIAAALSEEPERLAVIV